MDKHKLILPISILLGCIILGGFFYASQINKQKLTERQLQAELKLKQEQQYQNEQAEKNKKVALEQCLSLAETRYEIAMGYQINGTIEVPVWSPKGIALAGILKNDQDTCLKQYK
ncbi:MAG: hypothetical protein Q7S77_00720 [Candidatus Staskawiczbacteria bacterium]|nr:hypothetical protein [Candidatus Staskawiczbacteria bacterium]